MRIIVTGGAGFIGSHLCEVFLRKGSHVLILDDLSTGKMSEVQRLMGNRHYRNRVDFTCADISRPENVMDAVSIFKPEIICHLAAQSSITLAEKEPARSMEVNTIGTINVVVAASHFHVKRIIFASTSAVYGNLTGKLQEHVNGNPDNNYGISKYAAEKYLIHNSGNHVILRLGNVYGPGQVPIGENQIIPLMIRHLLYGDPFTIHGNGKQIRDFVHVDDVADAFNRAVWGEDGIYNVASGKSHTINQIARMVEHNYFDQQNGNYDWKYDKKKQDPRMVELNIDAARRGMGWKPRMELNDGIQKTINWWKASVD